MFNIIKEGGFTYEEGFDRICFIIDRDRESFVSSPKNNQYQYVIDKYKEMGCRIGKFCGQQYRKADY